MSNNKATINAAITFIDIALKYERQGNIKELSPDEVGYLFEVVSAAGFEPKAVVLGELRGNYRDQDGNTGETFPINPVCPFRVVDHEGDDNYLATGWLDSLLQRVRYGLTRHEDRSELTKAVAEEIERSVPLAPIQLTLEGDLLREYPPDRNRLGGFQYFVEHTRDDRQLGSCVGVHKFCNGWVDRRRATETHDAVVCRSCHLRVLFPREVKTYGDLRQTLAEKWAKVPA